MTKYMDKTSHFFLLFLTKYAFCLFVFVYRALYLLTFHTVSRINIIYHANSCFLASWRFFFCHPESGTLVACPPLPSYTNTAAAGQRGAKQGAHPL